MRRTIISTVSIVRYAIGLGVFWWKWKISGWFTNSFVFWISMQLGPNLISFRYSDVWGISEIIFVFLRFLFGEGETTEFRFHVCWMTFGAVRWLFAENSDDWLEWLLRRTPFVCYPVLTSHSQFPAATSQSAGYTVVSCSCGDGRFVVDDLMLDGSSKHRKHFLLVVCSQTIRI